MQRQGGVEVGGNLRHRAQRVGHQGAAAGAGLNQQHGRGAPQQIPGHRGPCAQQLAEHLADLRGGGEVGERVVGGVVGGVGTRHERVQSLRAVRLFGHGAGCGSTDSAGVRAGRAYQISPAPANSIGMHSNWPMVVPNGRKPRKASGSRKHSPVMRAMP